MLEQERPRSFAHWGKQSQFLILYIHFSSYRPACWDTEMLVKMLDAGMNIARLNFSHGDHETHSRTVGNLRAALAQRPGLKCAIMLDTKGPEIRSGFYAAGGNIEITANQKLKIVTDYSFKGDNTCIACSYKSLP